MAHHALGSRDSEDLRHIKKTNSFYVYWSSILVCLVITMRIVLLNLIEFFKVIGFDDFIHALSLTPVDKILKHHHNLRKVEFTCSTEPEKVIIIVVTHIAHFGRLDPVFELL